MVRAQQCLVESRGAEAAELLARLAGQGDSSAARQLGVLYAEGKLVAQDASAAARWLTPFAEKGDEDALRQICSFYLNGALQDDAQAVRWYTAAAAKGMTNVYRALADCYATGKGVDKNLSEAIKLYEQILAIDDSDGLLSLARCYAETGDKAKAMLTYEKAAALGNKKASAQIALVAFDEAASTRNYNKAFYMLSNAAGTDDAEIAARLAYCYQYGLGVAQSDACAAEWKERANQGGGDTSILSSLIPTQSNAEFLSSGTWSVMPPVYQLPEMLENNEDSNVFEFYRRKKIDNSIQYDYKLDIYAGKWKRYHDVSMRETVDFVTDEFIITSFEVTEDAYRPCCYEPRMDFWDSRTLQYCFSAQMGYTGSWYQYDEPTGRMVTFTREFDGVVGYCGSWAKVYDMNELYCAKERIEEGMTNENYDYDKPLPQKISSNPRFAQMTRLQRMPDISVRMSEWATAEDIQVQNIPVLQDVVNKSDNPEPHLAVRDINFDELRIFRSPRILGTDTKKPLDLRVKDVKGLKYRSDWNIDEIGDGIVCIHLDELYYRSTDKPSYIYRLSDKLLLPSLDDFYSRRIEGVPVMIGATDIDWYVVSYYGLWIVDKNTDKVYVVNDDYYDRYINTHRVSGNISISGLSNVFQYGQRASMSVLNGVPNKKDEAYWIVADMEACAICHVNLKQKIGRVVKEWVSDGGMTAAPIWISEHKWLCIPTNENVWKIFSFNPESMEVNELAHLYLHGENDFAISLPDGRYAGTPGCESFLYTMMNGRRVNMASLAPWRNRPAEVLEVLGASEDIVDVLRQTTERWLQKQGFNPAHMLPEPNLGDFSSVTVARPHLISENELASFPIKVKAGENVAVTAVEVRSDGVCVQQEWSSSLYVPKGQEITLNVEVPLTQGQNWIEVTPIDSTGVKGNSERFRIICNAEQPASRLFVVALGVSDYADDSMNLQYAAKDAKDIIEAFQQYYPGKVECLLLRDGEISGPDVLGKVKAFVSDAKPQDRVVMYCAGHGMLDDSLNYYYAPHGFDVNSIEKTGIAMEALLDILDTTSARTRLLLLDTCHSGSMGEEEEEKLALAMSKLPPGVRAIHHRGMKVKESTNVLNSVQKKRYIEELFATTSVRRGINVLAGATGAEYALESDKLKNGVFTASIIDILKGNTRIDKNSDGWINVAELYYAVAESVSFHTGGTQRPTLSLLENEGEQKLWKNAFTGKQPSQSKAPSSSSKPADNISSSTEIYSTDEIVSNRIRLSSAYSGAGFDEQLNQDIALCCAENVHIQPGNVTLSREGLAKNAKAFIKRWPIRNYTVLAVARRGNTVEAQVRYHCSDNVKTAKGYTLFIMEVDDNGRIQGLGEKTSKNSPPSFSSGMTEVPYSGPVEFNQ